MASFFSVSKRVGTCHRRLLATREDLSHSHEFRQLDLRTINLRSEIRANANFFLFLFTPCRLHWISSIIKRNTMFEIPPIKSHFTTFSQEIIKNAETKGLIKLRLFRSFSNTVHNGAYTLVHHKIILRIIKTLTKCEKVMEDKENFFVRALLCFAVPFSETYGTCTNNTHTRNR